MRIWHVTSFRAGPGPVEIDGNVLQIDGSRKAAAGGEKGRASRKQKMQLKTQAMAEKAFEEFKDRRAAAPATMSDNSIIVNMARDFGLKRTQMRDLVKKKRKACRFEGQAGRRMSLGESLFDIPRLNFICAFKFIEMEASPMQYATNPADRRTRPRLTFKKSDVKRAMRAAKEAGAAIDRVEITKDGKIIIFAQAGDAKSTEA